MLNASSLLFGDGDTTLGTLLDTGGSNQSTISAMSQDTLASLLNTICHSAALPLVDTGLSGLSQTQTGTEPNRRRENHIGSGETVIPCKCEDPAEQRTDWNDISRLDFQTIGRFCPSASTPHLPPASPAFADISLTDSMAGKLRKVPVCNCSVIRFGFASFHLASVHLRTIPTFVSGTTFVCYVNLMTSLYHPTEDSISAIS